MVMPPRTDAEYGAIGTKKNFGAKSPENGQSKTGAEAVLPLNEELVPLQGREVRKGENNPSTYLFCCGILFGLVLVGLIGVGKKKGDIGVDWQDAPFAAPDKLRSCVRHEDASPSTIWGNKTGPIPTNSWYLNLVSHRAAYKPDEATRAYSVPYILDTAAFGMPGLRVHWPITQIQPRNIQMVDDFKNSISLGTLDERISQKYLVDQDEDLSLLGLSLRWPSDNDDGDASMLSHIVRGMPYATMLYSGGVLPSLHSYNAPASKPLADGSVKVECGILLKNGTILEGDQAPTIVNKEIELHFINSDFTWIVFFSQPVEIQCGFSEGDIKTAEFKMNAKSLLSTRDDASSLVVRLALINQCTTGKANIKQHCVEKDEMEDREGYIELLRNSSHIFPTSPKIDFQYPDNDNSNDDYGVAYINFDWNPESSPKASSASDDYESLIMFALPHHQERLDQGDTAEVSPYCISTFHGKTCLVKGDKWSLSEDISHSQSFTARRPPEASAIPALGKAISQDIHYQLSDNLLRGAADTYFSGKILARVARTIIIASELKQLSEGGGSTRLQTFYDDVNDESLQGSIEAAASLELPSNKTITSAVKMLKNGVQVWLNGAEAEYLYDSTWGGLVNCGCTYVGEGDKGVCINTFPDCPALADVNIDFGNGYYNDHHYHYGYHVYAAAVVAKFDPKWGKQYFDKVLLYIRDYANPWQDDEHFAPFRHKDWWLGSSWASGIVSAENSPHGRNEESSSEAIAAYEGMALYGKVMVDIMRNREEGSSSIQEKKAAKLIRDAGELLTVTEVEAANRYWHVWSSDTHSITYPATYQEPVVGMLYDTMASFQTWFSPFAVVSYGIQLIPLTAVGEIRDDPEWAAMLYPLYAEGCERAGDFCVDNGWSILKAGLHATAGDRRGALEEALAIPDKVFNSEGGNGNSLSNTIWYIATRKNIVNNDG